MSDLYEVYKNELKSRIDAWEGMKTEDFQYDPERSQLKNAMKDWVAEKMPGSDEATLVKENKKLFVRSMAALVYDDKVKPNLAAFLK